MSSAYGSRDECVRDSESNFMELLGSGKVMTVTKSFVFSLSVPETLHDYRYVIHFRDMGDVEHGKFKNIFELYGDLWENLSGWINYRDKVMTSIEFF